MQASLADAANWQHLAIMRKAFLAIAIGAAVCAAAWWLMRPMNVYVRVDARAAAFAPGTKILVDQDRMALDLWEGRATGRWIGPSKVSGRKSVNLKIEARDSLVVTSATVPLAMHPGDDWNIDVSLGMRPQVDVSRGGLTWLTLHSGGPDTLWVHWTLGPRV